MRSLDPAFAEALRSGATTLCHCWRLTRHDGTVMGFTDHDRDVLLDGTLCHAGTGLDASQAHASLGLSVDSADVQGALDAQAITEADLANGLYDDASVEIWTVDWSDPTRRVLMDVATIGEVRRSEFSFVAELRSLAHRFDEERGRRYTRTCSAELGDERCRVDLSSPSLSTGGTVIAGQGASAVLVRLDSNFDTGFFTGGRLAVTSGMAAGERATVRSHVATSAGDVFVSAGTTIGSLVEGDRLSVTAGCDKSLGTCIGKFANVANFRGFPHMPGNDVLLAYANSRGLVMDGGSLFS